MNFTECTEFGESWKIEKWYGNHGYYLSGKKYICIKSNEK